MTTNLAAGPHRLNVDQPRACGKGPQRKRVSRRAFAESRQERVVSGGRGLKALDQSTQDRGKQSMREQNIFGRRRLAGVHRAELATAVRRASTASTGLRCKAPSSKA